MRDSRMIRAS